MTILNTSMTLVWKLPGILGIIVCGSTYILKLSWFNLKWIEFIICYLATYLGILTEFIGIHLFFVGLYRSNKIYTLPVAYSPKGSAYCECIGMSETLTALKQIAGCKMVLKLHSKSLISLTFAGSFCKSFATSQLYSDSMSYLTHLRVFYIKVIFQNSLLSYAFNINN